MLGFSSLSERAISDLSNALPSSNALIGVQATSQVYIFPPTAAGVSATGSVGSVAGTSVFVRSSSLASGATGTEPTGAALNDFLVAFVQGASGIAPPAGGWAKDVDGLFNTSSEIFQTYWIQRGASAPSYVFTGSVNAITVWAIQGASGLDAAGTFVSNLATSTAPSSPSITTVTNGALILLGLVDSANAATITKPADATQDQNSGTSSGQAIAHKTQAIAGATGTDAWGLSVTDTTGVFTMAMRPATSGTSIAITGVGATSSVGSVTPAITTPALAGVSATSSAGTVTTSSGTNASFSVVGVSATSGFGTLTDQISTLLAGISATTSVASVSSAVAALLAGVNATTSTASLFSAVQIALSGVFGTSGFGTVTTTGSSSGSGTLTGVSATSGFATLIESVFIGLVGVNATSSFGTITGNVKPALIGVSATSSFATLLDQVSISIVGVGASGSVATVSVTAGGSSSFTLAGVSATSGIGSLTETISASTALTSVVGTGAFGALVGNINPNLVGVVATGSTANVSLKVGANLSGITATASVGLVTAQASGNASISIVGVSATASASGVVGTGAVAWQFLDSIYRADIQRRGDVYTVAQREKFALFDKREMVWTTSGRARIFITPLRGKHW